MKPSAEPSGRAVRVVWWILPVVVATFVGLAVVVTSTVVARTSVVVPDFANVAPGQAATTRTTNPLPTTTPPPPSTATTSLAVAPPPSAPASTTTTTTTTTAPTSVVAPAHPVVEGEDGGSRPTTSSESHDGQGGDN